MTTYTRELLAKALALPPVERAELIEQLLGSFEFPDRARIDELWANEAEDRIRSYEEGKLGSRSAGEVFERIDRDMRK